MVDDGRMVIVCPTDPNARAGHIYVHAPHGPWCDGCDFMALPYHVAGELALAVSSAVEHAIHADLSP
jgi:hypothetical protein